MVTYGTTDLRLELAEIVQNDITSVKQALEKLVKLKEVVATAPLETLVTLCNYVPAFHAVYLPDFGIK